MSWRGARGLRLGVTGAKRVEGNGGRGFEEDGGTMGAFFVLAHGFQPFLEAGAGVGSGDKMGLARSSSGVWMEFEPQDEEEERPCSRGGTECSVETVMRERETAARRREAFRTGCGLAEVVGACLAGESCLSLSVRLEARTDAMRRIVWMGGEDCS